MLKNSSVIISIIIVNFNGEKFLPKCLNSVFQEKGNYEVIVVDDGSTDNSVKLINSLANSKTIIKLIALRKNVGAAQARNIGVRNSAGKYLLFLDNDTIIKSGWSEKIIHFFEKHKKAGFAQAKILKMGTNKFDYAGDFIGPFGFLIERARSAEDKGQFDKTNKIFALKSAAMLARKEVFKKLGGFDPDYQIFWEDTDLCWRNWLAGYQTLFAPQIIVYHAYGTNQKNSKTYLHNQVVYRGCRNNITSLIKNLGAKKLFLVLPINLSCWFALALSFFIQADFKKALAITKGVGWNLIHLPSTLKKRTKIQKKRKISDQKLFKMVGAKKSISYYFGKAKAYLANQPF